eukprot:3306776-Pyramimonas_sp.AAC.1
METLITSTLNIHPYIHPYIHPNIHPYIHPNIHRARRRLQTRIDPLVTPHRPPRDPPTGAAGPGALLRAAHGPPAVGGPRRLSGGDRRRPRGDARQWRPRHPLPAGGAQGERR